MEAAFLAAGLAAADIVAEVDTTVSEGVVGKESSEGTSKTRVLVVLVDGKDGDDGREGRGKGQEGEERGLLGNKGEQERLSHIQRLGRSAGLQLTREDDCGRNAQRLRRTPDCRYGYAKAKGGCWVWVQEQGQ